MASVSRRPVPPAVLACFALALALRAAHPQTDLSRASFALDDVLVVWQSGTGASIHYHGIPVFSPNPAEFVVHRNWTDIFHHAGDGHPKASLSADARGTTLTISDRTDHFAYDKRIIVRKGGAFRIEYRYEVLDPASAELQVLWGLGKQWIQGSKYAVLVGGDHRRGELKCPESGRIDPWSGASEQAYVTDFGTLTIKAEVPLNLLCTPGGGELWWAQPLERGKVYTQSIDVTIKPGPATDTGLVLKGIRWPDVVGDGQATFTLELARDKDGPSRVRVQAKPATGSDESAGRPVYADLGAAPREVMCAAPVALKGKFEFAAVVTDAATGAELLRLAPLPVESDPMLRAMPGLNLYTHEQQGQIVVDVADDLDLKDLSVAVRWGDNAPTRSPLNGRRTLVPVDLRSLPDGPSIVRCQLSRGSQVLASAQTELLKAPAKANEVKIDNASRSLIVDGLPFIPFGYYTYFPLKEGVMDEEVVRGFTLFSPYHGGPHEGGSLRSVREYMDRCAAIGMKVNFHLMWGNRTDLPDDVLASLRAEVEAFRDHPALLSWYIADEPPAEHVASLEKVYALVKQLDPYHPVAIVFCQGADHARLFARALDIVMADPYPIPNGPVTSVSDTADSMNGAYAFSKPLWIVPQAFGGNEGWSREPTAREQRAMTYLALIHGARGIQYFIRSPRTSFPKSPIMWAECGALALEAAELTPALTSPEPAPAVTSSVPAVHAAAFRERGTVTVLAVNTGNRPQIVRLQLGGVEFTGQAEVAFENRTVDVKGGTITEPIDAFGTRAYALPVGPMPEEDVEIPEGNLTVNPSWEDDPNVGTPEGNYASVPPGATIFTDSRVARHGRHSMRMTAPSDDSTPAISPFPVQLKGGQGYRVSLWGKANREGVVLRLNLGDLLTKDIALSTAWAEHAFIVKPQGDMRVGPGIALAGRGTAWVDLFCVAPSGK